MERENAPFFVQDAETDTTDLTGSALEIFVSELWVTTDNNTLRLPASGLELRAYMHVVSAGPARV